MKKPRKPCVECGEVLTGLRTRFCQNSCARLYDEKKRQAKYALVKIHLKDKKCLVCKKKFSPRTSRQTVCTKNCRIILSNRERQEKATKTRVMEKTTLGKGKGKFGRGLKILKNFITQEETTEVTMLDKSKFKNEIQEYLNSGGKVIKLSPQIAMKIPSIGVALKLGGWSTDQLQGFGVEIDLMEETNLDLGGLHDL
jgi:predicted nucleic acid-binding Zn ribbon protein